jgi:hypothetical protein
MSVMTTSRVLGGAAKAAATTAHNKIVRLSIKSSAAPNCGGLSVYDNNAPGVESTIRHDFSGSALRAAESCGSADRCPLRGLSCTTYSPDTPPRAVVLRSGLTISPPNTGINQAVGAQVSAATIGFHNSPNFQLVTAGDAGNVA